MRTELIIGSFVAILAGVMIGTQSTLISRGGALLGSVRVSMLVSITGAVVAAVVLAIIRFRGETNWQLDGNTWVALTIAGILGLLVMGFFSFASQRTGISTTLAAVFIGQMLISLIVDSQGWGGGGEVIPFSLARLGGLLLMGAGLYVLLTK